MRYCFALMEHQWNSPQMEDPLSKVMNTACSYKLWASGDTSLQPTTPKVVDRLKLLVKTAKHIQMGNTDTAGHINYDQSAHSFMMHQNTPLQDVGISPAEMLFGKPIKDHLPSPPDQLAARPQWKEMHEL